MSARPLYILGAGQHGSVVLEAALAEWPGRPCLYLDGNNQRHGSTHLGIPIVGGPELLQPGDSVVIAIGHNATRLQLLQDLSARDCLLPVVVHPRAYVSPTAALGAGTVLLPGAVVHTGATVGMGCIVNCNAVVEHDCLLADGVHVAGLSYIGAGCSLGSGTFVGAHSTLLAGRSMGQWSAAAAHSLLTKDVPDSTLWKGHPATQEGKIGPEFSPF